MDKRLLLLLFPLFLFCQGDKPTQTAGGGSDTEHSFTRKVTGKILYEDSTAVNDAEVSLISYNFIPGAGVSDSGLVTVLTDSQGIYSITPKAAGTYNISGLKDNKGTFIDSVTVPDDSNDVNLDDAILLCNGSLKGVLWMIGLNDINQVRADIYIPGSYFYTKPSIGGNFTLSEIPPGEYSLLIVPSMDDYDVKVLNILVDPCQEINLDTIFIGTSQLNNTAPIAAFSAIPETGYINEEINFSALECSDNEDVNPLLYVLWDFNNDGVWDIDWSLNKLVKHIFTTEGLKTVRLIVMDTDGLQDTCTREILIKASPEISTNITDINISCDENARPGNKYLEIWNSGTGELDYSITCKNSWIYGTPANGTCTFETDIISLIYDPEGLSAGSHSTVLIINSENAINAPETLNVDLEIYPVNQNRILDSLVFSSYTECYGLEYDGNYLWITDDNSYKIHKVDPLSGMFLETYDQEDYERGVSSGHDLAYDATNNYLYYQVSYGGPINLIDLNDGFKKVASLIRPATWIHGLDFDGHYLWIQEHDDDKQRYMIHKCDPDDSHIVSSFIVPGNTNGGRGIAWADGYIWWCLGKNSRYYKIDASRAIMDGDCSNAVVDSFDCPYTGRLSWDGNYLWVNIVGSNMVYKLRIE